MGVYPVGRAGKQRAVVLAFHAPQRFGILGFDDEDLIHAVRQGAIQDVHVEQVAFLELGQVGEHPRVGQARMPGEHRVGSLAADGHRRAFEVPDALLQRVLGRPVIDGQAHRYLGYLHGPHGVAQVEDVIVVVLHGHARSLYERVVHGVARQALVVLDGFLPLGVEGLLIDLLDELVVALRCI